MLGRDEEMRRLSMWLDGVDSTSGTMVIDGPAGIGKSAMLDAAMCAALDRGWRVVVGRPTEAESAFAFSVLGDLLRNVDLGVLLEAHRRAIEIALGARIGEGEAPSATHLGAGLIELLRSLAGPQNVMVMIDDLQWADTATREVLQFALRRLPVSGVGVIVGVRTGPSISVGLPEGDRISLGPIEDSDAAQLIRDSSPTALPLDVVQRLAAGSGGNPLFAVELARSMPTAMLQPGQPVPLPASLQKAIARRFASFSDATMLALAAVAMLARPTLAEISALGMVGDLLPAEEAAVISVSGRSVTFVHPLFASAAHDATPALRRLELRNRLADVTTGTERAIHRALGATRPDSAIAVELTVAAEREITRGAPAAAADLALLALDATPAADAARWHLLLVAGDALYRAGRTGDAVAKLREVGDEASAEDRARTLVALASIEYTRSDNAEEAARLARRALELAIEPDTIAAAHTMLARVVYTDFVVAAEHADAALTIIRHRDPLHPLAFADALNAAASARFIAGEGLDRDAFETAIELERDAAVPAADSAFGALASHLKIADELDEAQSMLELIAESADPGSVPYALAHLAQLHTWAGRWDEAERYALRHMELAEQTGQVSQAYQARFNLATVAANRGDSSIAEEVGREMFDEGRAAQIPWTERHGAGLLGFAAMTRGDAATAVRYFARYDEVGESMRLGEPGYLRLHGDFIEALIAVGDTGQAIAVLDRLEAMAERTGRVSALATVDRGRALIAAHGGDRDTALTSAHRAIERLVETPLAYDRARAQMTLGVIARRFRERTVARVALEQALSGFETMGAVSLAKRAQLELQRVGGPRTVDAVDALTATEAQVARLVADGATNREIADTLFINVKTVEANLTRVYRKLQLNNRAQLAVHMSGSRR